MKYKFLFLLTIPVILSNCKKEENSFEKRETTHESLINHKWQPIHIDDKQVDNSKINYKPTTCELDNVYSFSFSYTGINSAIIDKGTEICNEPTTFESIFNVENVSSFTYNFEKNVLIFSDNKYESYLVKIENDILILSYQNSNPAANYIPIKYQFKRLH